MTSESSSSLDEASTAHSPTATSGAPAHSTETTSSSPTTPAPVDATPAEPATASFPLASTAIVPTQRAARYGKQLVSHMAHKVTGAWDEETASGYLLFDREGPVLGRFDVIASPSDLRLELRTTPERAAHLEHVAGIHLARFGVRDGLAIAWERTDGSEGTTQGPLTPADIEAHARERAKRKDSREAAGQ